LEPAADDDLRAPVERMHRCRARLHGTVRVREPLHRYALREHDVHGFELEGHALALLCYAWLSTVGRAGYQPFRVVLARPPVVPAADAVGAAIQDHQGETDPGRDGMAVRGGPGPPKPRDLTVPPAGGLTGRRDCQTTNCAGTGQGGGEAWRGGSRMASISMLTTSPRARGRAAR